MKKPFILMKRPREIVKLCISAALCLWALSLFFAEDSVAVFAQKDAGGISGLFGLIKGIAARICL